MNSASGWRAPPADDFFHQLHFLDLGCEHSFGRGWEQASPSFDSAPIITMLVALVEPSCCTFRERGYRSRGLAGEILRVILVKRIRPPDATWARTCEGKAR